MLYLNVHLHKEDISKALIEHIKKEGFDVKKDPLITLRIDKAGARVPEQWTAVISDCKK